MKRPPSSDRRRSLGLWKYWFGLELLYVLASEERILQRRNRLSCINVSRAQTQGLEGVLWYVYRQSDDRASSEVDDSVDSDHFQVQLNSTGPLHGAGHHQGSTDRSCLLRTKEEEKGEGEIFKNGSWKLSSQVNPRYARGLWADKTTLFSSALLEVTAIHGRASFHHLAPFQCFAWTITFWSL